MSAKSDELEAERKNKDEASKEAQLTLLLLHKAQEIIVLPKSENSDELIVAQRKQLMRCKAMLSKLIQQPNLEPQSINPISVEVIPPNNGQLTSTNSLQIEALLYSYKFSLERATKLLKQELKS